MSDLFLGKLLILLRPSSDHIDDILRISPLLTCRFVANKPYVQDATLLYKNSHSLVTLFVLSVVTDL